MDYLKGVIGLLGFKCMSGKDVLSDMVGFWIVMKDLLVIWLVCDRYDVGK